MPSESWPPMCSLRSLSSSPRSSLSPRSHREKGTFSLILRPGNMISICQLPKSLVSEALKSAQTPVEGNSAFCREKVKPSSDSLKSREALLPNLSGSISQAGSSSLKKQMALPLRRIMKGISSAWSMVLTRGFMPTRKNDIFFNALLLEVDIFPGFSIRSLSRNLFRSRVLNFFCVIINQ